MNANYHIEPTESNTFVVRCDSERFGKNAIVYESYSRDACVEYVSQNNAPREWKYYIIPDLKTWASNTPERTPIEYYDTLNEALERFQQLRPQAYNAETGGSYAHLTFGMESAKAAADLLHVRENQNYLVDDFTRLPELNTDKTVLSALSETARTIGFDRIRTFHKGTSGIYANAPVDMAFSEWNNPYFDANKKMEPTQAMQRKRNRGVEL